MRAHGGHGSSATASHRRRSAAGGSVPLSLCCVPTGSAERWGGWWRLGLLTSPQGFSLPPQKARLPDAPPSARAPGGGPASSAHPRPVPLPGEGEEGPWLRLPVCSRPGILGARQQPLCPVSLALRRMACCPLRLPGPVIVTVLRKAACSHPITGITASSPSSVLLTEPSLFMGRWGDGTSRPRRGRVGPGNPLARSVGTWGLG